MSDPIDYERMSEYVRQAVRDEMKPLADRVAGHERTLYGTEGRNGLVGDVNRIKFLGAIATGAGAIWAGIVALGKLLFTSNHS